MKVLNMGTQFVNGKEWGLVVEWEDPMKRKHFVEILNALFNMLDLIEDDEFF